MLNIQKIIKILQLYVEYNIDFTINHIAINRLNNINKQQDINNNKNTDNLLAELKQQINNSQDCDLKITAQNTVFARGSSKAKLMIIGEAPGTEEDMKGVPFVGPSGKLLDTILASINLNDKDYYMINIIPWRPPGNRNANQTEINFCLPWAKKHIQIIKPKILLLLGNITAKNLLNLQDGVSKIRGKKLLYNNIPTVVTFHPEYILRNVQDKKKAWNDILLVKQLLNNI